MRSKIIKRSGEKRELEGWMAGKEREKESTGEERKRDKGKRVGFVCVSVRVHVCVLVRVCMLRGRLPASPCR